MALTSKGGTLAGRYGFRKCVGLMKEFKSKGISIARNLQRADLRWTRGLPHIRDSGSVWA